MKKNTIVIIGNYPPPMGGAAKNTKIISDALSLLTNVIKINTSVGGLTHNKSLNYHYKRIVKTLSVMKKLFVLRKLSNVCVYIVPDGGVGIIYTLLYFLVCRTFSFRVYAHHRTFQYIDHFSFIAYVAFLIISNKSRHIFLSKNMAIKFSSKYILNKPCLISDNARYVTIADEIKLCKRNEINLGYISNLCYDKGILELLETFDILAPEIKNLKLLIGGEAISQEIQKQLTAFKNKWGNRVEFWGYVDGDKKTNLYDEIDIFIFPTKFKQEAQPNVIYEAMSRACVCIAWERGCIAEMFDHTCGKLVYKDENFVKPTIEFIRELANNNKKMLTMKNESLQYVRNKKKNAEFQFEEMIESIISEE